MLVPYSSCIPDNLLYLWNALIICFIALFLSLLWVKVPLFVCKEIVNTIRIYFSIKHL